MAGDSTFRHICMTECASVHAVCAMPHLPEQEAEQCQGAQPKHCYQRYVRYEHMLLGIRKTLVHAPLDGVKHFNLGGKHGYMLQSRHAQHALVEQARARRVPAVCAVHPVCIT